MAFGWNFHLAGLIREHGISDCNQRGNNGIIHAQNKHVPLLLE